MSSTVVNLKYPRPPGMNPDAKLFKCPCCCQALPVELAENDKWKKHLAGDIVPYTCILPNCATPDVLFPTKDAWRRHLLEEHFNYEYWTCSICREGIELPDEESFIWHTKTQHAGSIRPDRIPVLAGLSRRSSPTEMKSCPICGWPQSEGATADKESLIEHVAKEVHAFSLRSLPWADGPEHAADGWTRKNHEDVINWMWEIEPLGQPPSLDLVVSDSKLPAEPALSHMGYFQRNPYFADNSSRSSSEHTSAAAGDDDIEDHPMTPERSLAFENSRPRPSTSPETGHGLINKQDEAQLVEDTQRDQASATRRYCNAHGCRRKTVYGIIDNVKIRSLYCQEHTCQGPRSVLEGFCSTERVPTHKCCFRHGKCSISNCFRQAPRSISQDDLPWTCPEDAVELLLEAGEDRSRYSQLLWEEKDRRARAAAKRERARLAQEDADARRRAADQSLVDDLRRERLVSVRREEDREMEEPGKMEEDRRREEDEMKRRYDYEDLEIKKKKLELQQAEQKRLAEHQAYIRRREERWHQQRENDAAIRDEVDKEIRKREQDIVNKQRHEDDQIAEEEREKQKIKEKVEAEVAKHEAEKRKRQEEERIT